VDEAMCPVSSAGWITALHYVSFNMCNQSGMTLSCLSTSHSVHLCNFNLFHTESKAPYKMLILKTSEVSFEKLHIFLATRC